MLIGKTGSHLKIIFVYQLGTHFYVSECHYFDYKSQLVNLNMSLIAAIQTIQTKMQIDLTMSIVATLKQIIYLINKGKGFRKYLTCQFVFTKMALKTEHDNVLCLRKTSCDSQWELIKSKFINFNKITTAAA